MLFEIFTSQAKIFSLNNLCEYSAQPSTLALPVWPQAHLAIQKGSPQQQVKYTFHKTQRSSSPRWWMKKSCDHFFTFEYWRQKLKNRLSHETWSPGILTRYCSHKKIILGVYSPAENLHTFADPYSQLHEYMQQFVNFQCKKFNCLTHRTDSYCSPTRTKLQVLKQLDPISRQGQAVTKK